jgi:hypothetical protein
MSTAYQQLQASYAFIERNANLVKRYWTWELVWLIYSIANSLSVSYIGLGMESLAGIDAQVDGRSPKSSRSNAGREPSNTPSWRRYTGSPIWPVKRCSR